MNTTTEQEEEVEVQEVVLVLRLTRRRHVTFTADTVDNEHHNLKKSKVCCIKHQKKGKCDVNKYERG